jgi:hypothetical protein
MMLRRMKLKQEARNKMKTVYFETLGLEGKIPDNYDYIDLGQVDSLFDTIKKVHIERGLPTYNAFFIEKEYPMHLFRLNQGGIHFTHFKSDGKGGIQSIIFYSKFAREAENIKTRAHEETHAICHLGLLDLRKEIKRRIRTLETPSIISRYIDEEQICDLSGIYVLKERGIEIPSDLLLSYEARMANRKRMVSLREELVQVLSVRSNYEIAVAGGQA